jgi:uncharacterized membrane protein YbhN (UPF0104 family)
MATNSDPECAVEVPQDDQTDVQPVATSVVRRRWGSSVFGIVAEGHFRRRPSDIVAVAVAAVVIPLTAAGSTDVTQIERAAFDLFASLPSGLEPVWEVLYLLTPIAAVVMLVVALVARRGRMLATEAVAAGLAALVGAALSATVEVPDTVADAGRALLGHTPDFPVVLMAGGAAVIWASRPYLTRPARRLLEAAFWLSALAAAALAEGLPGAVIASIALAWGAAAVAHLCFGSPAATPSEDQVAASLRDLGVDPAGLHLAPEQTWGSADYTAGSAAELSIEVVGRDATDARLFAKVWRFIWYKDSEPTLSLTRVHQVEHEAYVVLLALRTGARVPDLVAAGLAGWRDDALLAVRNPPGARLPDVGPERLTDAVLDDAWANLGRLHGGRIAHGNPWVGNLVLDESGTAAFVGLGGAVASATDGRLRLDRVQLLATSAELVGEDRALAAAHRALSVDDLVELLAFLEPTALTGAAKRHVTKPKALLASLRDAGAALTGVEPPKPAELHRFSLSSVVLAAAFAFGVYLLVAQLAGVAAMGDIFSGAIWGWILLTFVVAQLPQLSQAVAMLGAVSARLPFGPVIGVQFANAFTGLVGGTAGNATLVIRFFQKQGLPPAVAASSGVLTSASGFIVQAFLILIAVVVTGPEFDLSIGSDGEGIPGWLVAVIAVLALAGVVLLLVPSMRQRVHNIVETQLKPAWQNLRSVVSNPRKAVQLFGGNLASQLLYALVLGAALHAYGASLPLLQLVLINCIASFIGGAAPVPGGMGVIETGLIAGFTASGIPEGQAVAATFTARMCTSYLPPIWGWFALARLRKKDYV